MRYPEPPSSPPADDDSDRPDVRTPPVPPDQEDDVIPQRDPPKPGQGKEPPLIARPSTKSAPAVPRAEAR